MRVYSTISQRPPWTWGVGSSGDKFHPGSPGRPFPASPSSPGAGVWVCARVHASALLRRKYRTGQAVDYGVQTHLAG